MKSPTAQGNYGVTLRGQYGLPGTSHTTGMDDRDARSWERSAGRRTDGADRSLLRAT